MEKYLDEMGTKASIIVMSHLSDAKMDRVHQPEQCDERLEFTKFIILKLNGDLTKEVNADLLWEDFLNFKK